MNQSLKNFFFALAGFTIILSVQSAKAGADAIYSVPIVSPDLQLVSEFPTRSDQNAYGSPAILGFLRFSLPPELTGLSSEFEIIRQLDGTWAGKGTDGSTAAGECATEEKWFSCRVVFKDLKFDASTRVDILEKAFGHGFAFGQRLEVARQFEGQPIGIIKVRIACD